ncbi:MAG: hypothetical protein VYE22_01315 [Myxococcota bacterium]|nr:hypothetical protein [Myxococcota bacterium]
MDSLVALLAVGVTTNSDPDLARAHESLARGDYHDLDVGLASLDDLVRIWDGRLVGAPKGDALAGRIRRYRRMIVRAQTEGMSTGARYGWRASSGLFHVLTDPETTSLLAWLHRPASEG